MPYPVRTFEYATIIKVVDGDTCDILLDLGYSVKMKARFRLIGIDTPERGHIGWQEATYFLKEYEGASVVVKSTKVDKYGRYLAEIYAINSAISLNQILIDKNLAVIYNGKTKKE